jgi:hypothetical protein
MEGIVPLSPDEATLLALQWSYDQSNQEARQLVKPRRTDRRFATASSPPRSTEEVAARLRHLVAMLAARERLKAALGRMDREVVIPASDLAESSAWRPEPIEGRQL